MRVALVNNFFPPRAGGSAHFTDELARRLAAKGDEVLVLTSSADAAPGTTTQHGYVVTRLPALTLPPLRIAFRYELNLTASPRNLVRLWQALDEFRPDVVHINNQIFDLSIQAQLWAWRRKVPVVCTIHTALIHDSRLLGSVLAGLDIGVVRSMFGLARTCVVAPDRFMDRYVRRRYRPGSDRLAHIPIGVDVDRFLSPAPSDVRRRLGIDGRPMILSLGHIIPMIRDRLTLVEALPHVLRRFPDAVVVIAGHAYDDAFRRRADELGVSDSVLAIGSVAKDEVPGLVAAADIEAHDLDGWGFGTASMEVMAAGVPVVAGVHPDNFPGLPLVDGENIALVPISDPTALAGRINELLGDPEARAVLGKRQQAWVTDHLDIGVVADRYRSLYGTLAAASASSPASP